MCIGCQEPGCVEFGGPADYPCDAPLTECDVKEGAGVTITGNFGASNKRCELFGDQRYIVKGEPALAETFQCIATLGEGPKTPLPMRAMRKSAIEPAMLYNGGCNDGFLRKDALLAVVVLNGEQDNLSPGTPQHVVRRARRRQEGRRGGDRHARAVERQRTAGLRSASTSPCAWPEPR
jgi:hypothetical protein